jgi:L-arabinose isomerase
MEGQQRTSVALDKLVDKYNLGSMAYLYKEAVVDDNEDTISSMIREFHF